MDKGSLCCSFIDHLATSGQFSCLWSLSHQDVCDRANVAAIWHITLFSEIWLRLEHVVLSRGKLERRLVCHDAALEKRDAEIKRLQKLLIEKPSGEMARLRLEGDNLSTINAKYQDLLRENDQLELCNASLRAQVDWEAEVKAEFDQKFEAHQRRFDERVAVLDACLDKMDKERDEEFSPMLRDVKKTKEFLIGKGFRYFLNKFKESDILGSRLGACISATISDGMRQGLEAGFVHGKKGTNINSIPTYNPDATEVYVDALKALNDVSFPLLEQVKACAKQLFSYLEALFVMGVDESIQDEVGTSTNPASGETSSAGGGDEQFIIAPSVPYAGDAGATSTKLTLMDGVSFVDSDLDVLAGTAPNYDIVATLASALEVLTFGPSTLVIPTSSPF
ncbi:hypothetical protein Tco_1125187 [Tanacetum coccineum]|uniref:Uncharacterized protein n=1 Tax=Tanacetum coccineum TaxID=301880 RepID=A0ABQ5J8A1_9ASTR